MLKKTLPILILLATGLLALIVFIRPTEDEPDRIELRTDSIEVTEGDSFTLDFESNLLFINFSSSDYDVVRQVPGGWQAFSPGSANITVSSQDGQIQETITVQVKPETVQEFPPQNDSFTVNLDGNPLEFTQAITLGELNIPIKDGFTFLGWAQNPEGNVLEPNTVINEDIALFAVFEMIELEEDVEPSEPNTEPDPEDSEPVEDVENDEVIITPSAVYSVTLISEMGHTLSAVQVTEGGTLTPLDFSVDESAVGYFKPGQICDQPYDFSQPIQDNIILIYGVLNFTSPCIELDEMAVTGDLEVGETLKAYVSPSAATVMYEWLMSDDNRDYYFLRHETSASITLLPEHHRLYVAVVLTGTGDYRGVLRYPLGRISLNQRTVSSSRIPISSWEDLANMPTGSESSGKTFILTQDLDQNSLGYETYASQSSNEGEGWQPIGDSTNPFMGSFDGNGFSISDLKIDRSDNYQGLFGVLEGNLSIIELTLISFNVTGNTDNDFLSGLDQYIGLVAGETRGTVTLKNILTTGTSVVYNNTEDGDTGGFIGNNSGTLTIEYSTNAAIVRNQDEIGGLVGVNDGILYITKSNNFGEIDGDDEVGGLVGDNDNTIFINDSNNYGVVSGDDEVGGLVGDSSLATIINSHNFGSIDGEDQVGGIVGDNDNVLTLTAITNNGKVTADGTDEADVGGLVGQTDFYVIINNSHNNATITGIRDVGGLVGGAIEDEDLINKIIISNSFNSGTITGENEIGGLIGDGDDITIIKISNSYNTGNVSTSTLDGYSVGGLIGDSGDNTSAYTYIYQSFNSGDIYGTGDEGVGGLIGEANGDLEIYQSYNSGSVILDSGNYPPEFRVGGIVGYIYGSNITFSGLINIGPVSGTAVNWPVIAGGLIGDVGNETLGKIEFAYNIGLITAEALNVSVGGLLGISNPGVTLEHSYYLTGTALNAFDNGDSSLAKEDTEIRNESEKWDSVSYSVETGSDVSTMWIIDFSKDGIDYVTYPWFPWMEEPIDALIIHRP